ncbi:isoprenylcysteine carboxylmethyltransferase family protein [Sphingomonas sp. CGMCC 1.13654]|uniref:Isoprenylcysteine carboxylmethyltransferase family protein n=1 Tax=Sphingomonas chungangi TaxID=2683589 RepID=A0A838L549_9SPHN|nr:isoprenylcysteine carboxylmethyltransferase family protein [Sphingomonas chungangi]MBA2932758.1 isoprenylcysteine carboxylmethyltransferase family protein [Sphingomonas chungangi]MVW56380.1 isoprenylcysteine carboxylmethyltransferase family protein [Sphingomonas chungangi]
MTVSFIATIAWWLFIASWWAASWWVAKATTTAPRAKRLAYFAGFAIGFTALFAANHSDPWHRSGWLLWHNPAVIDWLLLAGQIAAFAFAWWARVHLGKLWSGMLTLREGHRVVDTGPYRLARHPIYTGFIAAGWCYALIETHPIALFGAAVLTIVMTVKAKEEERFLRQELGAADYDAYAARTRMLVPLPK